MDYMYQTVDKDFVETIVGKLKSQGIFDQFRKDCLADVDTKPAYQNLQERVNGTVNTFLEKHKWQENLNKTQLRESLRRHVQQGFLETGVDRIVDQVVNPKIYTVFKPKVEDVVYASLGIPKPIRPDNDRNLLNFILKHPPPPHPPPPRPPPPPVKDPIKSNVVLLEDLLPKDLDPISPGSVDDLTFSPKEDEQNNIVTSTNNSHDIINNTTTNNSNNNNNNDSSAFELISTEMSNDESKLSLSDLTSSPDSTKNSVLTGQKSAAELEIESNTNSIGQSITNSLSPFKNFSNLNEKLKQAEVNLGETDCVKTRMDIENDLEEIDSEQDFSDKLEKEESSSFKILSEDSTSSVSSISRERKSLNSNINTDVPKNEETFNDSQKSEKMDECDSSLSNNEKLVTQINQSEKKEEKAEKRHSESSKHKSSRHNHDSKRDSKHHNHDSKKVDKSKPSRSDKDKKHHEDRHKKKSKDRRDGGHKENKSKEETDNKHGEKSSKHRENDDKPEKFKHRDCSEKPREEREGKIEKSTERSNMHIEEDRLVVQDESKSMDGEDKQRYSDSFSFEIEDNVEEENLNERPEEFEMRNNETDENMDLTAEKENDFKDCEENVDSYVIKEYEKEKTLEKHEKSRHREEKQEKIKSKESEDKSKESRIRSKEGESRQRSDRSTEKMEKSGKHRDRSKEERSSKSEKIKHTGEPGDQQKEDKARSKDAKSRHNMDYESGIVKEERIKSDERGTDKEKSRKHSDKSKSKHSSSSSGKHKSDKEEKKDREARKRKGERCEEIKVKESRRSSDRDHNGPGSGFSSSAPKEKDSTNGAHNNTNESSQDQGREGSSSVEENTDSLDCIEEPTNDVDILLMKINDSIENDLVQENRKEDEKLGENIPSSFKKPKIANNIFEIKKIMQARRNIEKMEALENQENKKTFSEELHEEETKQIVEADSTVTQTEEIREDELPMDIEHTEDIMSIETSLENLTESLKVDLKENEEVEVVKLEEFDEKIREIVSIENEIQTEEVVSNVVAEPSFIKKHRIANNIYEVRKIMHMKKRLEKKQKQAALLNEENLTMYVQLHEEVVIEENQQAPTEHLTEEQSILENETCDLIMVAEDNLDMSASNLAKESDITKAIEENQSNDTIIEEETIVEGCRGDDVENEEPKTLKTPRIARNIDEVRQIIRARRAMKRKLKLQTKNCELNMTRKHTIKSFLNSKKIINLKRKNEQIVKFKLLTKERKNRIRRESNSKKILDRNENSKIDVIGGNEVIDCPVPCEDNGVSVGKQRKLSEALEERQNRPVVDNGFLGFTQKELDIARNQLEELKRVRMSYLSKYNTTDTQFWNNQLDGNSNMVKTPALFEDNKKKIQAVRSAKVEKNNAKLITIEKAADQHEKVVRDILTGKNGCSIKLTKSSCLDERAKCVSRYKSIRLATHNNVELSQDVEDINSNLEDCNNINETKKYDWNDRVLTTSLTEDVLDNLMIENNLVPAEDSPEYAESLSTSEENFKIMPRNKNVKSKEPEIDIENNKLIRCDGNSKVKLLRNCTVDEENVTSGKECSSNSNDPVGKPRNNPVSTQEEKQKRTTRNSLRSTQRYDSEDLYKPRLTLSQSSSRTRCNRSDIHKEVPKLQP
ncbi:uncharacterized protein isoform X3 [Rhodnius prolixus]|uniref:uncharacterized protein isoform X3 n=1 Tax=Rhodnius prolixus TaxID=13249 RepID=UPI003D18EAB5